MYNQCPNFSLATPNENHRSSLQSMNCLHVACVETFYSDRPRQIYSNILVISIAKKPMSTAIGWQTILILRPGKAWSQGVGKVFGNKKGFTTNFNRELSCHNDSKGFEFWALTRPTSRDFAAKPWSSPNQSNLSRLIKNWHVARRFSEMISICCASAPIFPGQLGVTHHRLSLQVFWSRLILSNGMTMGVPLGTCMHWKDFMKDGMSLKRVWRNFRAAFYLLCIASKTQRALDNRFNSLYYANQPIKSHPSACNGYEIAIKGLLNLKRINEAKQLIDKGLQ